MTEDPTTTWNEVQTMLPAGWVIESLRCASTGLAIEDRCDDWIAVALGPDDQRHEHRDADPHAALRGLARDLAQR